jgi:prevent-host-death family protein
MSSDHWTVAKAKARLSELIERARTSGPQTITRNRRDTVVVVSIEEWERKTRRKGNLAEFLSASPASRFPPGGGTEQGQATRREAVTH